MSVLITAASHAAAYKIERLLNLPDVIFADHHELPHFKFSGKKFIKIPAGNSASYAHEILNIALNEGIKKIFPLYADEILPLAEARQLFSEYGISVMVPSINWFTEKNEYLKSSDDLLVIIETGKLLAGKLPQGVMLNDPELSGLFRVVTEKGYPVFKLFTV